VEGSIAKHSDLEGQAIRHRSDGPIAGSISAARHEAFAAVGRVEVSTYPPASTAAQNDEDGHETATRRLKRSIRAARQVPLPAAGRVEVITSPAASTAAQNVEEGHETEVNARLRDRASTIALQADAPPVGWVETNTRD
jgi:hypothetical protein